MSKNLSKTFKNALNKDFDIYKNANLSIEFLVPSKYLPFEQLFALDFSKTLLILLRGKTKSKIFVKAKRQRQPV